LDFIDEVPLGLDSKTPYALVVQDLETIRQESRSLLKNLKAHDW